MPADLLPMTMEGTVWNNASFQIFLMVREPSQAGDRPVLPIAVPLCLN